MAKSSGDNSVTSPAFFHKPVMFDEVMSVFKPIDFGLLVDGTLGAGGHSFGFLSQSRKLKVVGIDRDQAAITAATEYLGGFSDRFRAVHQAFDRFEDALSLVCDQDSDFCDVPSALFLDLGVSSPQLDFAERGFSYRLSGPLDMRMDPTSGISAAEYLDTVDEYELANLLKDNGESRFAKRIAKAILQSRPIESTTELADVIKNAIPAAARRTGGHPATRVFQALRIAVNGEIERLTTALERSFEVIAPGGRIAVLSYHSGEDSIVKALFRDQITGGCNCPPRLGCVCGAVPKAKFIVRSKTPSDDEIGQNPRSRSARLRAIELLEHDLKVGD